ncbi:NAD-dependent succinate-semialdehyde dehydrogenase [Granulicella sp. dw_53]|uniref:NAD-dependent succinate-semialdehyde dehydrogenase n=1 Tax=Granulicella sp. dw_53 TaxID=2719792 RepID=UPI001BD5887C|nr:NAD-dependent succinate-semialdehyde dehydrogenase [Granulicella sp. dw_53]
MAIESINPANGRLLRHFEAFSDEVIRQRIAVADDAFRAYATVPLEHRALWMRKLAAILEHETEELATTITLEMGKPIPASRQEVLKCASTCRYYADHSARILAPEAISIGSNHSYVRWDPLGIVLAVMPWNFPFWQVFRFLAPALMAGNVGLLKHSSNVPQCAIAIESLVRRAGFPRGTFQTLLIESKQVEMVLGDERVAAVTVTGSEAAGRAIAAQAGWLIKKSVLELGGSDPFIVMPSANLDLAIETAVQSRCVNNGQSCIAAKRFLVADEIYDQFESRFVAAMEEVRIGDPMKDNTEVGPLATKRLVDELEAQVKTAQAAGARILTGGERMVGAGNYFEPTVLVDVPRSCPTYREELFGPVAMLFRVTDLSHAIQLANDTPFGLAASAWTREPSEQQRLVTELQCGQVFLNAMVSSDPRLPFGGIKRSGYGRELSAAGMREFLNAKTVVIASPGAPTPHDDSRELIPFPDRRDMDTRDSD